MKILFIGKTMNYYIGDGINIKKSDNTTGKVEIDVEDWKGNQLLTDFPEDFKKVEEVIPEIGEEKIEPTIEELKSEENAKIESVKTTEQTVEFNQEINPTPDIKKDIIGNPTEIVTPGKIIKPRKPRKKAGAK